MKPLVVVILLLLASFARGENIDLYVMAGQSNMFGIVPMPDLPAELSAPQAIPFKYSLRYLPHINFVSDGFIDLQPLSNFTPVYGGPPFFLSTFASELSFGQKLQQESDNKIAILKVCANGSSLAVDWNPASPTSLYHRLIDTTSEAIAELTGLGYQPSVQGLVWVQGETDAETLANATNYASNLGNFLDELRSEVWFPADVPIVANQLHVASGFVYKGTVRDAQATVVAARSDNVHLLNNDDLSLYTDQIHYTGEMQIEVGKRLANYFVSTVPEPSSISAAFAALCVIGLHTGRQRT